MGEAHKRQLRNYLLDRKLQLRFSLIVVVISALLTTGLGYIWYDQMRQTSKVIDFDAAASMGIPEQEIQQMKDDMKQQDNMRLLVLIGFGVLFALVVAGGSIIMTHKVAGPLFKISRYMSEIRDGRLGPIYNLRRGDQLQDFFVVFKEMHNSLRRDVEADLKTLNEIIASTERHLAQLAGEGGTEDINSWLEQLREIRDRKEASLKS